MTDEERFEITGCLVMVDNNEWKLSVVGEHEIQESSQK